MNKKRILIILGVVIFLCLGFVLFKQAVQTPVACLNGYCFKLEIAKTVIERAKGLMFREKLDENKGMLFIFPTVEKHGFWMKNTLIPLDIIWIDESNKVVYIKKNVLPCKKKL